MKITNKVNNNLIYLNLIYLNTNQFVSKLITKDGKYPAKDVYYLDLTRLNICNYKEKTSSKTMEF
jgi:hypothetical protein